MTPLPLMYCAAAAWALAALAADFRHARLAATQLAPDVADMGVDRPIIRLQPAPQDMLGKRIPRLHHARTLHQASLALYHRRDGRPRARRW